MGRRFANSGYMGGRKGPEPTLPDSELEVMRVIWRREKATARDISNDLTAAGSKWTYATVNTILQRLEAKGHVDADKTRMSFVYSPAVSQKNVAKKRVKQLIDKFFDGSAGELVKAALRGTSLSDAEKKEVKDALAGRSRGGDDD